MLLAAADTSNAFAFDAATDNLGMIVMGIIVTVSWLAFRRMIELSEEKKKKNDGASPKP
jgi:hypothetical protein